MRSLFSSVLVTLLLASTAGLAQAQSRPNDYANRDNWLCRPDELAACQVDLTTTAITDAGTLTRETWKADPSAPIDCFYVYPTVSTDRTLISDMRPDAAELEVIHQQFARFAAHCRPFAPMYRQVTRLGLLARITSGDDGAAPENRVPYEDVRDAWRYYLEHDNNGRGVVLIGHSQGSHLLVELLRQEIDGQPAQEKLVSALLIGTTVAVPRGKDVGGTFRQIPLCHAAGQTGCLIVYSSYRATNPPPADARFGRVDEPGMTAACTNPAALAGGSGELRSYFSTEGRATTSGTTTRPWLVPEKPIETPWVSLPGLLTAECKTNEYATYLAITVHGDPATPRIDDIAGDMKLGSLPLPNWGLHVVDVNIAIGNLVDIVGSQGKVWAATGKMKTN